jgi:hypothetical protein
MHYHAHFPDRLSRNAMNQAVTFLSDGGDTVRDLQMYLNQRAGHLLEWFHVSMRPTEMSQLVKPNGGVTPSAISCSRPNSAGFVGYGAIGRIHPEHLQWRDNGRLDQAAAKALQAAGPPTCCDRESLDCVIHFGQSAASRRQLDPAIA